jgi:hypothetical protein
LGASLEPEIHPSMNLVGSWLVWSCHVCLISGGYLWKGFNLFQVGPFENAKNNPKEVSPPSPKGCNTQVTRNPCFYSKRIMITRQVKLPGLTEWRAYSQKV